MRNAAGIIARNQSAIKSINIIIKFNIEKKYELPCPCSKSLIRLFTKHQYWILFTCRCCLFILSPVQCFRAMQHSQLVVHKCFRVGLLFIVLSSSLICWLFYCQNLRNFRSMNFYLPKREMFFGRFQIDQTHSFGSSRNTIWIFSSVFKSKPSSFQLRKISASLPKNEWWRIQNPRKTGIHLHRYINWTRRRLFSKKTLAIKIWITIWNLLSTIH